MVQAWDFVDADVLWQTRITFLQEPLNSLDLGDGLTARFQSMCKTKWRYEHINGQLEIIEQPLRTVADLLQYSERELMREPNFGKRTMAALKKVLAVHDVWLRP